MMLAIYTFFLSFQIAGTVACAILSYRIAYLKLTPTLTWLLIFFAFIIRFITQINSVFYIRDIINFADGYNLTLVIVGNFLNASVTALFFVAILRIYKALRENGVTKL